MRTRLARRLARRLSRLSRLPLFELWPARGTGAAGVGRRSDLLEWYAWVSAALFVALAVPASAVAGLLVAGEPAAGAAVGVGVMGAAVGVAAGGLWLAYRRLARRRDLEWTTGWRVVARDWAAESGDGGRTPGPG